MSERAGRAVVPASVRVLGVGMGPQHVTPEVADALRGCDYVVALAKRDGDELVEVRRAVCDAHGVELVVVEDPDRDRTPGLTADGYQGAVRDWHQARAEVLGRVIGERGGVAGLLVWGDPSLYDSTIRVVEQLGLPFAVWPGISAPQLLAARHRIVLHEVGRPVHVTTARRLAEAVESGQDNVVVMLASGGELAGVAGGAGAAGGGGAGGAGPAGAVGIEDWVIWWGANLGAAGERLVSGRVGDVLGEIQAARAAAKAEAGWVMDLFLVRRVS